MKKILYILLAASVLSACEKVSLIDDEGTSVAETTENAYKVSVVTRAATSSSDIMYPILIKAVDASGSVVAQQSLNSDDDVLKLALPNGKYTISAISGYDDFSNGYSTKPMLIGNSNVDINNASTNVNIIMSYAVASIDVTMADVPSSVTSVSVTLSPLYGNVSISGSYSGTASVTLPCTKGSDGNWTTGTMYVMPGASNNTVMSVSVTSPGGTNVFGITYPSPLKIATPYHFKGTYSGGGTDDFSLTGTLKCEGWGSDVTDTFSFGPKGSNSFTGEATDCTEVEVTAMPSAGDVWNGHVVAYNDGGDALLISLQEWVNMTSALYEADPYVAKDITELYSEGDICCWSMPTTDQARLLKTLWNADTYADLNRALESVGGTAISLYDNEKAVRYLCDDAFSTFSFASNSVLSAGATVKTYRLRLVKKIRFRVVG